MPGSSPSWPATKTKPFATIAWLYGAPWNGAGASSVRTTCLLTRLSFRGAARLADCCAERLEDRAQHILGVLALEDADVDVQPGALGELLQEDGDDVAAEAADTLTREIDVRGDEGPFGDLEHRPGERLVGRKPRKAAVRRRR